MSKNKRQNDKCIMANFLEVITDADNVYRTKNFIVKQSMTLRDLEDGTVGVLSNDTFFARTTLRDNQYEIVFESRKGGNGKRLPSTMYTRKYIN